MKNQINIDKLYISSYVICSIHNKTDRHSNTLTFKDPETLDTARNFITAFNR